MYRTRRPFLLDSKPTVGSITPLILARKRLSRISPTVVRECPTKIVERGSALEQSGSVEPFVPVIEERNLDSILKVPPAFASHSSLMGTSKAELGHPTQATANLNRISSRELSLRFCERRPGMLLSMLSRPKGADFAQGFARIKWASKSVDADVLRSGRKQFLPENKLKRIAVVDQDPVNESLLVSEVNQSSVKPKFKFSYSEVSEEKRQYSSTTRSRKDSRPPLPQTSSRRPMTLSLDKAQA